MNNSIKNKFDNTASKLKNTANAIKNKASNIKNTVSNKVSNVMEKTKETANKVSKNIDAKTNISSKAKGIQNSISNFESQNTTISKVVFIIFVIIIFGLLFRLGVYIITLFYLPKKDPIVVNGMRQLLQSKKYNVNPTSEDPKPILRSINENQGMEFTWANWLFINNTKNTNDLSLLSSDEKDTKPKLIFSKGKSNNNDEFEMNSPGIYLFDDTQSQSVSDTNTLSFVVELFDISSNNDNKKYEIINIPNIPLQKWVHIVIRVQSKTLDIYINGMLTKRENFNSVIKQNYGDVYVGNSNGVDGFISDLKYFSYAIDNNKIQELIQNGPNLKMEGSEHIETGPPYLSMKWYMDTPQ